MAYVRITGFNPLDFFPEEVKIRNEKNAKIPFDQFQNPLLQMIDHN